MSRFGQLLQERDFLGDEAGLLRRELVDDDRPRPAVGRIAAQLEAVRQFGDHADVRFPPPFAVGDDVETGRLLQGDGVVESPRPSAGRYSSALMRAIVGDQFFDERRPRQRADDRRREQHVVVLIVYFSQMSRLPVLPGVFEILLRVDLDVAAGRVDVRPSRRPLRSCLAAGESGRPSRTPWLRATACRRTLGGGDDSARAVAPRPAAENFATPMYSP